MVSAVQDEVVVTGLGATTPLGGDVATFWEGLLAGRSGVGPLTQEWAPSIAVRIAAQMAVDPRAMPLKDYIAETIQALGTDADEVLVPRVGMLRNNPGPNEAAFVNQFNDMMAGETH